MPVLTIGIVRVCFYLPFFYSDKLSTSESDVCRSANINLNLSNITKKVFCDAFMETAI